MPFVAIPLPLEASAETRLLLSGIGRTEDVNLSPSGRLVAIAEFLANRLVLLPLSIRECNGAPAISVGRGSVVSSAYLRQPHGLSFLDETLVVVANRRGHVAIFDVSQAAAEPGAHELEPVKVLSSRRPWRTRIRTPGSVSAFEDDHDPERRQLLVCNNDWHTVSSHRISLQDGLRVEHDGIRIERALGIPDGIDVSPDRRWMAVSNHMHGQVLIYENKAGHNRHTPPVHVVPGLVCPHGLRFDADGKRLLVADSASPYLHVLEPEGGSWDGREIMMRAVRMMDDESFWRCRSDAREGGIKGIDLDDLGSVLVTTRLHQPLGFYRLSELLDRAGAPDPRLISELSSLRDRSLQVQKADALRQRWSASSLVRASARRLRRRLRRRASRIHARLEVRGRGYRNRWCGSSILAASGPVVTLATYGARIATVYAAIESIARGEAKPSRILLWIGDASASLSLPRALLRLAARGLEIRTCDDFGPHTKYYPYLASEDRFRLPLVTADDDVLYPRVWLRQLLEAHERNPRAIHAFRVHRMALANGRLQAYTEWTPCRGSRPSHLNFGTGVSGVLYPAEFLGPLRAAGHGFSTCCPRHDDVWLKVQALRSGFPVAQVGDAPVHFRPIPGAVVHEPLSRYNVRDGGAHVQILATFSASDLAILREAEQDERAVHG